MRFFVIRLIDGSTVSKVRLPIDIVRVTNVMETGETSKAAFRSYTGDYIRSAIPPRFRIVIELRINPIIFSSIYSAINSLLSYINKPNRYITIPPYDIDGDNHRLFSYSPKDSFANGDEFIVENYSDIEYYFSTEKRLNRGTFSIVLKSKYLYDNPAEFTNV